MANFTPSWFVIKLEIYVFLLASWQPPSWISILWANIASANQNRWDKTRNNLFVWSHYEVTWKIRNRSNFLNFRKFQMSRRNFEMERRCNQCENSENLGVKGLIYLWFQMQMYFENCSCFWCIRLSRKFLVNITDVNFFRFKKYRVNFQSLNILIENNDTFFKVISKINIH